MIFCPGSGERWQSAVYYIGFDVVRRFNLVRDWRRKKLATQPVNHRASKLKNKTFAEQEFELTRLLNLRAVWQRRYRINEIGMQLAENMVMRFGHRVEAGAFHGAGHEELAFCCAPCMRTRNVALAV